MELKSLINGSLKNYLRCSYGVKKSQDAYLLSINAILRLLLPCISCLENVFQRPVKKPST